MKANVETDVIETDKIAKQVETLLNDQDFVVPDDSGRFFTLKRNPVSTGSFLWVLVSTNEAHDVKGYFQKYFLRPDDQILDFELKKRTKGGRLEFNAVINLSLTTLPPFTPYEERHSLHHQNTWEVYPLKITTDEANQPLTGLTQQEGAPNYVRNFQNAQEAHHSTLQKLISVRPPLATGFKAMHKSSDPFNMTCTRLFVHKECFVCHTTEHSFSECPNRLCQICGKKGPNHDEARCPERCTCGGKKAHKKEKCPNKLAPINKKRQRESTAPKKANNNPPDQFQAVQGKSRAGNAKTPNPGRQNLLSKHAAPQQSAPQKQRNLFEVLPQEIPSQDNTRDPPLLILTKADNNTQETLFGVASTSQQSENTNTPTDMDTMSDSEQFSDAEGTPTEVDFPMSNPEDRLTSVDTPSNTQSSSTPPQPEERNQTLTDKETMSFVGTLPSQGVFRNQKDAAPKASSQPTPSPFSSLGTLPNQSIFDGASAPQTPKNHPESLLKETMSSIGPLPSFSTATAGQRNPPNEQTQGNESSAQKAPDSQSSMSSIGSLPNQSFVAAHRIATSGEKSTVTTPKSSPARTAQLNRGFHPDMGSKDGAVLSPPSGVNSQGASPREVPPTTPVSKTRKAGSLPSTPVRDGIASRLRSATRQKSDLGKTPERDK